LTECNGCKKNYVVEVRILYDLASDQRCERGEPPIELREFDTLNIAHVVSVDFLTGSNTT